MTEPMTIPATARFEPVKVDGPPFIEADTKFETALRLDSIPSL